MKCRGKTSYIGLAEKVFRRGQVWGVGFYRFSGYSAKLSRAVVNYLIFREKVPKIPPPITRSTGNF
ncbi:hypothetical protein RVR34_13845 [Microcystis aeruginosa FBCC-A68]|uniref:hypothetical protein n=1 Tax=Microcystis aeruginosa TaxID=1126 RepID=UPI0011163D56|nr:hypothetical protein [Microcystis aeruginosa]